MSTQTNQYLMWGIRLPYKWAEEWAEKNNQPDGGDSFYERFGDDFMDDSAYEEVVKHTDGIFCLMDGRDGRFIIIGRVIEKAKEGDLLGEGMPISPYELTELERELIQASVKRNFGVEGEFRHWFVTMFR